MNIFANKYKVPPFCPVCAVDRRVLYWKPHRWRFWKETAICIFDRVPMVMK